MYKALTIAMLHFRQTFKSKGMLFMGFGLPLLMTLIFGTLISGMGSGDSTGHIYPVAVVDRDSSYVSDKLVEALRAEPSLRVNLVTEEQMTRLFREKQIDSGVVIPAGFQQRIAEGKAPELQVVAAPGGNRNAGVSPAVSREASRVAGDYRLARKVAGSGASEARVAEAYDHVTAERKSLGIFVAQEHAKRPEAETRQDPGQLVGNTALGFTVMFVMMVVFMMGGAILQERQNGTWGRLLTTPTSRVSILTGYLLSFFVTGMAQFAVLVGLSTLLFGIEWGPLLPLTAMASALVLCSAGMGLFLAGIVRTHEQQTAVGVLVVTATSMLGGVYWPLDFVGEPMRRIGYLTPQAWAMDGFREVMLRGGSWDALFLPLAVLLALTVIFMTAGLLRVRYE